MSDLRFWQQNVFQILKDSHAQNIEHARKMESLGLARASVQAPKEQSDEDLLQSFSQQLLLLRSQVKQNCGLIRGGNGADLSQSLREFVTSDVAAFIDLAKQHLLLYPTYNRVKVYGVDGNYLGRALHAKAPALVLSFCDKMLKGINRELAFALRTRIDGWLSQIPIGGKEKRFYKPDELVNFALANGLEEASPESIYLNFVEKKMATLDLTAQDDDLNEYQFEPLSVDEVKKTPAQVLTRGNQLCTGACKTDPRDGKKKCTTKPFGPFGIYKWDYCN